MKSTLLHKQIRVAKFNSNLAKALVEHDLLLDDPAKRKQNRISAKEHLNTYTFRGEEIKTEKERKQVLLYVESLYKNDNENFDSTKFSKAKYKFKKWIDNEKTPEKEKELYIKLLKVADSYQDRTVNIENAINKLLSTSEKVSRLNNKKKAIQTLLELHNQKTKMNVDSESQLNSCVISTIFKIPKHNKNPLTGEEQQELLNSFYKENFPDYEIIYSVVHNDETDPHAHNMINGKNQKTNKYDFVQNQYEYILNKIELDGFPAKYSECSTKQVKLFGELIQQDFYDFINAKLENKNIIFEKKKYNSKEEKALDRENIKNDTSKPIADRAYNTATYLEEEKNNIANENAEFKKENTALKLKQITLNSKVKELEKKQIEIEEDNKKNMSVFENVFNENKALKEENKGLKSIFNEVAKYLKNNGFQRAYREIMMRISKSPKNN